MATYNGSQSGYKKFKKDRKLGPTGPLPDTPPSGTAMGYGPGVYPPGYRKGKQTHRHLPGHEEFLV